MEFKTLLLLCCLSVAVIYCQSAAVYSGKPSDMEVGTLGPEDKLLFRIETSLYPESGFDSIVDRINSEHVVFSFINGTEGGNYPDARCTLIEGGPGFGYAAVMMATGDLKGFDYVLEFYGIELPSGNSTTFQRIQTKKYFDGRLVKELIE